MFSHAFPGGHCHVLVSQHRAEKNTERGGELLTQNWCGDELLTQNWCGDELLTQNWCGGELLTQNWCGGELLT